MRDRYTSALSMPPPLLNSTYCLYTYTHTCGAKGMCTKRGPPCLVGPFFFFRKTCLAESGQSKSLVVLDSEAWGEKATIPLDVGRRFFRVKGEDQPLPDFGEVRRVPCLLSVG